MKVARNNIWIQQDDSFGDTDMTEGLWRVHGSVTDWS